MFIASNPFIICVCFERIVTRAITVLTWLATTHVSMSEGKGAEAQIVT